MLLPNRILFSCDVLLQVDPKSKDQVDNDWRSNSDESGINKEQPDIRRSNAQSFPKISAYAEYSSFHKVF